jgi:probable rRNA maturation factor
MNPRLRRVTSSLARLSGPRTPRRAQIILTDDRTIADLAGRFRGSPYPTDVLAFTYDDDPDLAGEVVISLDTAKRQAAERGVDLADELKLLCVHGLWHISGVGDETKADWREMRTHEFETLVKVL